MADLLGMGNVMLLFSETRGGKPVFSQCIDLEVWTNSVYNMRVTSENREGHSEDYSCDNYMDPCIRLPITFCVITDGANETKSSQQRKLIIGIIAAFTLIGMFTGAATAILLIRRVVRI
jgi:hypothetical protein